MKGLIASLIQVANLICKIWLGFHALLLGSNQSGLFVLQHLFAFFVSASLCTRLNTLTSWLVLFEDPP